MKNNVMKFFRDSNNELIAINYSKEDQKDYFKFIKSQKEKGMKQIAINYNSMIDLLKEYYLNNYTISSIMVSDDSDEQKAIIDKLLTKMGHDRAFFINLLDILKNMNEEDSLDIEEIILKKNPSSLIKIKVNGIVILESENTYNEIDKISKIIKRDIVHASVSN